jgi:hypothetical protein
LDIYIYRYLCLCVCACVCPWVVSLLLTRQPDHRGFLLDEIAKLDIRVSGTNSHAR